MLREPSGSKRRRKNRFILFFSLVIAGLLVGGCATEKSAKPPQALSRPAKIVGIKARSFEGLVTVLEITNSAPASYTAFKLVDPPRVVLDISAQVAEKIPANQDILDPNLSNVRVEKGNKPNSTRIVAQLKKDLDYKIKEEDNTIIVTFTPKGTKQAQASTLTDKENKEDVSSAKEPEIKVSGPRIFFKPKATDLNQILGVDFTMLDHGKSRLIITSSKKATYHLERRGPNELVLRLANSTIPELLQRHIDSSEFEGAVERVKATYVDAEKQVALAIRLREMVPFHIVQNETEIRIDFGPSDIKPPEKKIYPLALAPRSEGLSPERLNQLPALKAKVRKSNSSRVVRKYTGTPMTMDFVNADVTNILRLIGEVSNLNIVWGPEVKGKVSMRLRNVPWDQALDLILANNNLAMRREGNVIWVTTREQMAKIEAEERKKREDLEKRIAEQKKRAEELKKLEPIETQYITINYVDVENIKKIIESTVKSDTGKITVDKDSKTIIMTDTISKLKEAREVARRLDKPTKQVMIEARIVEASTSFSRELGVQWSSEVQHKNASSMAWRGTPEWAVNNTPTSFPGGGSIFGPSFSTNHPNFASNLGLVFTTLSSSGLTGAFIDTQIALSESEGELKVLSSPKIVTRDTVTATIQQGTKIVLPSGTDSNGNKTYELVDASLKLEVTPKITPNDRVILDISISDDFPDYANARGESVPIKTKSASTTMMVASGDTVIIGGIYKDNEGVNTTGQPWLKDIPIIGWLFKAKSWNDARTELLIFLTPTVLPSG